MASLPNINLPVWDGNREKFPELNTIFLYKDRKYLTSKIKGNLKVVDIEKEEYSIGMTIRLLGANSYSGTINVLIKSEVATIDEIADAMEDDKGDRMQAIFEKFTRWIRKIGPKKFEKFVNSKGVTVSELYEMANDMREASMRGMILEALLE
jgi:hypothetical protein